MAPANDIEESVLVKLVEVRTPPFDSTTVNGCALSSRCAAVVALRVTVLVYDTNPDVIHEMDRCAALVGTLRMTSLATAQVTHISSMIKCGAREHGAQRFPLRRCVGYAVKIGDCLTIR